MAKLNKRIKIAEGVNELTSAEFNELVSPSLESKPKTNKYHNIISYNEKGERFASKRELSVYRLLQALEEKGNIRELRKQVPFELYPTCKPFFHKLTYVADFTYMQGDKFHVIDVKGVRTGVYKIKKRLMYERFGILIEER